MTNRERAEQVITSGSGHDTVHDCMRANCSEHDRYEDCEKAFVDKIERALDEAEKRGILRMTEIAKETYKQEYIKGQKEMMERVAKTGDLMSPNETLSGKTVGGEIRPLPIEGEKRLLKNHRAI